jgi:hypothetical protein
MTKPIEETEKLCSECGNLRNHLIEMAHIALNAQSVIGVDSKAVRAYVADIELLAVQIADEILAITGDQRSAAKALAETMVMTSEEENIVSIVGTKIMLICADPRDKSHAMSLSEILIFRGIAVGTLEAADKRAEVLALLPGSNTAIAGLRQLDKALAQWIRSYEDEQAKEESK